MSYNLTNQIQPSFSGLTGQTVTYGEHGNIHGHARGRYAGPGWRGSRRHIEGVTHDAKIGSDGSFSTQFTRQTWS